MKAIHTGTVLILSISLLCTGCNQPEPSPSKGVFTDSRDGHVYTYTTIGQQVWMAENLAWLPEVGPDSSFSQTEKRYYVLGYKGSYVQEAKATANYFTYGVLYNWPAAMDGDYTSRDAITGGQGACPPGWHLPADQEWKNLEEYLGMEWSETIDDGWRQSGWVGGKLKESGLAHWLSPNLGATDSLGFKAIPGGYLNSEPDSTSSHTGKIATFWTAKAYCPTRAWYRSLSYSDAGLGRFWYLYSGARSVRCVRDI